MKLQDKLKGTLVQIKKTAADKTKQAIKNYKNEQRITSENIKILQNFTKSELMQLKRDYDVEITYGFGGPSRDDYIESIASELTTQNILDFEKKRNLKQSLNGLPTAHTITIVQNSNVNMEKSTFVGDVKNSDKIFNDFKISLLNSPIDLNLKQEALEKIKELETEMAKPQKDKTKIEKLLQWFSRNKSELVTLSLPFIEKILSSLK